MTGQKESALRKVAREIRKEAVRQIGGFPKEELRQQLARGWGREFAHQLFGTPRRSRHHHRSG